MQVLLSVWGVLAISGVVQGAPAPFLGSLLGIGTTAGVGTAVTGTTAGATAGVGIPAITLTAGGVNFLQQLNSLGQLGTGLNFLNKVGSFGLAGLGGLVGLAGLAGLAGKKVDEFDYEDEYEYLPVYTYVSSEHGGGKGGYVDSVGYSSDYSRSYPASFSRGSYQVSPASDWSRAAQRARTTGMTLDKRPVRYVRPTERVRQSTDLVPTRSALKKRSSRNREYLRESNGFQDYNVEYENGAEPETFGSRRFPSSSDFFYEY